MAHLQAPVSNTILKETAQKAWKGVRIQAQKG